MGQDRLRHRIAQSLRRQGFVIKNGKILPGPNRTKDELRSLHHEAVQHRIEKARPSLERHEDSFLGRLASGGEVVPEDVAPRLVEVKSGSQDELLFRYVGLHWSIPVSSGYGRRLRFLVIDESNEKLIGIIGLGDPVFSLTARDDWVGWAKSDRRLRLRHVMDAFILGAVPPYSMLLGGKLVAMLVTSDEVRKAFKRKYSGRRSLISRKQHDGRLVLVTTTSALGRSSVYNRLKYKQRCLYHSIGYTRGSGDFHFMNGLYDDLRHHAELVCKPTAKHNRWGKGFRSRREVVKKCLAAVGLSTELLYHRVEREVFAVPLAKNTQEFLCGEHSRVQWHHLSAEDLSGWFRERWLMPRAARRPTFREFTLDEYRIWDK